MRKYLLHIMIFSFVFVSMLVVYSEDQVQARNLNYYRLSKYESRTQLPKQETVDRLPGKTLRINLHSSYRDLSLAQVQSMSNISIRKADKWGFYGHSTINHHYEEKSINGDDIVIDHATGLMWHQSGSVNYMRWNNAGNWIRSLNYRGYAGYHDWRLPTLEEAVSLLEPSNKSSLYIDSAFDSEQWGIWTGDKYGLDGVWSVYFSLGNVRWNVKNRYVRPVRSLK